MTETAESCPVCTEPSCKGNHRGFEYYEAINKPARSHERKGTKESRQCKANERIEFALATLRANPTMSIEGTGGITSQVRQKFGQGCKTDELYKLKRELNGKLPPIPIRKFENDAKSENDVVKSCAKMLLEAMSETGIREVVLNASGEMTIARLHREKVVLE